MSDSWVCLSLFLAIFGVCADAQCEVQPCENGATCQPVYRKPDEEVKRGQVKQNFKCFCPSGFTGNKCQWPCEDVYRSCDALWKKEQRCTIFRKWTTWYDTNCPVTCGICPGDGQTRNRTRSRPPFAPILEPLMWLIGHWRVESPRQDNFPVDFDRPGAIVQEMKFDVAQVPMFGTPVLNYTMKSWRKENPEDIQLEEGFISVKDRWKVYPVQVALMRTNNNGAIIFEEGDSDFASGTMNLNLTYWKAAPSVKHKFPLRAVRRFSLIDNYLQIETVAEYANLNRKSYSQFFARTDKAEAIRDFEPTPATAPPPTLPDISGVEAGDPVPEEEIKIAQSFTSQT